MIHADAHEVTNNRFIDGIVGSDEDGFVGIFFHVFVKRCAHAAAHVVEIFTAVGHLHEMRLAVPTSKIFRIRFCDLAGETPFPAAVVDLRETLVGADGKIVEIGTAEEIYYDPRHPYTQGLFNSLPNMEDRSVRLKPIRGLMPDPSNLPEGCAFCDRCDYATERCFHEKPQSVHRNEEHYVVCHLYNEENIQKGGALRNE